MSASRKPRAYTDKRNLKRALREAAVESIPYEIETRKRLCPKYRRQRFYFVPVFHPVTSDDANRLDKLGFEMIFPVDQ